MSTTSKREVERRGGVVAGTAMIAIGMLLATPIEADPATPAKATPPEASTSVDAPATPTYSPYADEHFPRQVFFGDLHVHSSWSADAGNMGNRRIGPDEAFRFARGEELVAHNGMAVKLRRPLDFLLVSDHAEYLGVMNMLDRDDPVLLETETGARWSGWRKSGRDLEVFAEFGISLLEHRDLIDSPVLEKTVWGRVVENAERWNEPGRFTAFIGYEWTATPGGKNLHRNVLLADGAERARQVVPTSSLDDPRPESLWDWMVGYEQTTGGRVLAIPHNSNVSGGLMFALQDSAGAPFDAAYARRRARLEPIVEATQYKGDSETHPLLSPNDEFADYETWDRAALGAAGHEEGWLPAEYVRPALRNGLAEQARLGVNPFQFGLIGSTDAHTGLATADEDDFWGKATKSEPSPTRWETGLFPGSPDQQEGGLQYYEWEMAASGYAAVWATENTREALFDAMQRRETYATTGPRMTVRFFGGFDFEAEDATRPDLPRTGYAKGVPMGGELAAPATGEGRPSAPTFLVGALRDPEGANLDRVQIVKGWLDAEGATHERVYDVAVSGGRRIGRDGRARKAVGSTVDVENVTWSNTIGAAALTGFWKDPDFDPAESAFYYVRVLEIPKPRWTAYDRRFFGVEMPEEVPMTTQDRAYTSPIWYTPTTAR
ncbi:MAG: DUF3604 domain-containing protein [Spirochaetaceae bacterium]|nr:DUF3604 domain-containing protein [Spirochaetaceae bacterium]